MATDLATTPPRRTPYIEGSAPLVNALHVVVVVVLALASLFLHRFDPETAFWLALVDATWVLVLVLVRAYRLTGDALNVMSLSALAMLLLYPFHGLVMRDSGIVLELLGSERYEYFTYGLLVAIPGALAMYWGFRSGRAGRVSRFFERVTGVIDDTDPRLEKKLILLLALGIIARVGVVATGTGTHFDSGAQSGGESHFILTTLATISRLVALYFLASGARLRLRRRLLLGLAFILADAAWGGLFSGSRYLLFVPLLSAAAVWSAVVSRVTLRRFAIVIVLFATIGFPLATAYKNAYTSHLVELQRHGLSAATVLDSLDSTSTQAEEGWEELIGERFHALTSLAVIIRFTPERHPYMWGKPYLLLPLDIAVPRVVWPDKPVLRQFTIDFRFDYFKLDRGTRTSVAPSQFGELWVNLSLFGVILGAFVWGRILRFLYSFLFLGGRRSVFGAAVYATMLPALTSVLESEQVTGMATVVKGLIVWFAVAWFLGDRSPQAKKVRG
ncbi:MAG: hypothetical protein EP329_24030 [Deltaproteobacteria bacterium]|nr:MAG: hypothetical protein EP329_24030 [Deltaproteobacteria bacterium]